MKQYINPIVSDLCIETNVEEIVDYEINSASRTELVKKWNSRDKQTGKFIAYQVTPMAKSTSVSDFVAYGEVAAITTAVWAVGAYSLVGVATVAFVVLVLVFFQGNRRLSSI